MMSGHTIKVDPAPGGWSVEAPIAGYPKTFHSGAEAEAKAKALGACLAQNGEDAIVEIRDRRLTLVGTAHYYGVG
jgi:hypothetical protein